MIIDTVPSEAAVPEGRPMLSWRRPNGNLMPFQPINVYDYELLGKETLPKPAFDFIAGGATDEHTLGRNRAAFDATKLRPRMLVDVTTVDISTAVLGQKLPHPIMLAPAGAQLTVHPEAETASLKGAGAEGALMVIPYHSAAPFQQLAAAATAPIWRHITVFEDRGFTLEKAREAEAAGCAALCLVLDTKVGAKRERNIRNDYYGSGLGVGDPAATWKDMDAIASAVSIPVVAKGVMTAEDARSCVEYGALGVIVSNHGGRSLDGTFATIEVLPEVAKAVGGAIEVYLDGGIRRGTDIVKALALGARGVFIGRPFVWGLALAGAEGVRAVIRTLVDELVMAMGMCGRPSIASLDSSLIGAASPLEKLLAREASG